jgi:hypothetical protein
MEHSFAIGINTGLTEEQRRGLILLHEYQKACKKTCGGGYRYDPLSDEQLLDRPGFKQAVTVAKWLDGEGLKVGKRESNWAGYVDYVFQHFSDLKSVPAVGQLKNVVLLKKYFQHAGVSYKKPPASRSDDVLERLYRKVLTPEFSHFGILQLCGLQRTDRAG